MTGNPLKDVYVLYDFADFTTRTNSISVYIFQIDHQAGNVAILAGTGVKFRGTLVAGIFSNLYVTKTEVISSEVIKEESRPYFGIPARIKRALTPAVEHYEKIRLV